MSADVDTSVPYVDPERRDALRRKARRDKTVSTASIIVVLGILVGALVASPGWDAVQETFFSPDIARIALPEVLEGFWLNVKMFLIAEPAILLLALLIAVSRGTTSPVLAPVRLLATIFTDVMRGIPTILLVFLLGFGVPALRLQGLTSSVLVWGTVALILSYSAYVAEVLRAGIESIHPGQRAAARSLGLSEAQTLRHVVLPQAFRRVAPPLLNDFASLQKDTALISVLGPIEALRAAQIVNAQNFNYTSYVVAAVLFIALVVPLSRYTDHLADRARHGGIGGGR